MNTGNTYAWYSSRPGLTIRAKKAAAGTGTVKNSGSIRETNGIAVLFREFSRYGICRNYCVQPAAGGEWKEIGGMVR